MASKTLKAIQNEITKLDNDKEKLVAIVQLLQFIVDNSEDEEDEEDGEVKPPRKTKAARSDDDDDDNDDDNDDDDDDNDDDDDDNDDEPKRNSKKDKTVKKTNKKVTKKTAAKPAAKATDTDYSEMSLSGLKGVAKAYGLDAKAAKLKTQESYEEMLTAIDKMAAKKPVEYFMKLARKNEVEVKQPRGRSSDEKKSRVAIVALINEGHSPL